MMDLMTLIQALQGNYGEAGGGTAGYQSGPFRTRMPFAQPNPPASPINTGELPGGAGTFSPGGPGFSVGLLPGMPGYPGSQDQGFGAAPFGENRTLGNLNPQFIKDASSQPANLPPQAELPGGANTFSPGGPGIFSPPQTGGMGGNMTAGTPSRSLYGMGRPPESMISQIAGYRNPWMNRGWGGYGGQGMNIQNLLMSLLFGGGRGYGSPFGGYGSPYGGGWGAPYGGSPWGYGRQAGIF